MKKISTIGMFLVLGSLYASGISPYIRIAELSGSMNTVTEKVKTVLSENSYDVIGSYQPGDNENLYVVIFTSKKIKDFCRSVENRGMLAAALKVGFQKEDGKISVSIVNPEYMFYAYFKDKMNDATFKSSALNISSEIKSSMGGIGTLMKPFGGDLSANDLMKYHYMVGMPYFDDPVQLADFDNFQQGLATIRRNLASGKGNTQKVYEIIDESNNVAVFGVCLTDKEGGEAHFLPILGESHVAAMPYEIILLNNRATILHARYRFALYWPELTMTTFSKIMTSPGDVEEAMTALVK